MKFFAVLLGLWLPMAAGLADGGVVLAHQTVEGLNLTVFASPVPLRAGPVDVSVLVQDPETGRAVLDAAVEVSSSVASADSPDWMPPCCSMEDGRSALPATRGHSQNQLLYSAIVPIRRAGSSELFLNVKTGKKTARLTCKVQVQPPRPPFQTYWPLLALPPFAVAGFALHQRLRRKA